MKRKRIRKILIIAFSVCLVAANVTSFTYAVDPVTFTEAETLGATIVDLYGAYNNTSLAYEQLSESGALTEVVTLYNNYASNASDPYTLAAIGAAAAAAGAIAVIYDAVTGQGYVQLYQEQYLSSMDGYWDYQLTDSGLVRDSLTGLFSWSLNQNNTVSPISIFTKSNVSFNGHEVHLFPFDYRTQQNDAKSTAIVSSNGYWIKYFCTSTPTQVTVYYFSDSPLTISTQNYYNGSAVGNPIVNNQNSATNGYYSFKNQFYGWQTDVNDYDFSGTAYQPNLDSLLGPLTTDSIQSSQENINILPSTYIGDPLQNPLEITVPDPSNPDYNPQPVRINTDIEWDPEWGTPIADPVPGVPYPITDPEILNDAVPGIWDAIVSNGVEVGDVEPTPDDPGTDPNEVTIPFLPITLPSFNLNLSGIWHYVVTWVASLGAWFTTLFTIWSCLPYAMVVPVYATAVIVIVLGVYRRFLT